jgi:uncharacterized protein YcfL
MKKTLLSSVIVASLATFGLVGCMQSDTQTTIDTVNASSVMMMDSVQSLTRHDLLATDRLAKVDGATIKEQSQAQVEALKQQLENAVDGTLLLLLRVNTAT